MVRLVDSITIYTLENGALTWYVADYPCFWVENNLYCIVLPQRHLSFAWVIVKVDVPLVYQNPFSGWLCQEIWYFLDYTLWSGNVSSTTDLSDITSTEINLVYANSLLASLNVRQELREMRWNMENRSHQANFTDSSSIHQRFSRSLKSSVS